MVVWLSVPTSVSGKATSTVLPSRFSFAVQTALGEIFEIDLMADAGAGRHDGEVGEGLLAPLEEAVALLVLLVFARHVLGESPSACRNDRRRPNGR